MRTLLAVLLGLPGLGSILSASPVAAVILCNGPPVTIDGSGVINGTPDDDVIKDS